MPGCVSFAAQLGCPCALSQPHPQLQVACPRQQKHGFHKPFSTAWTKRGERGPRTIAQLHHSLGTEQPKPVQPGPAYSCPPPATGNKSAPLFGRLQVALRGIISLRNIVMFTATGAVIAAPTPAAAVAIATAKWVTTIVIIAVPASVAGAMFRVLDGPGGSSFASTFEYLFPSVTALAILACFKATSFAATLVDTMVVKVFNYAKVAAVAGALCQMLLNGPWVRFMALTIALLLISVYQGWYRKHKLVK